MKIDKIKVNVLGEEIREDRYANSVWWVGGGY